MGSNADVWLDVESPNGDGLCAIDGDMNGRLEVHGLPANRSVRIGERLGNTSDVSFVDSSHFHAVSTPTIISEGSPRGTRGFLTWPADTGEVQVINDATSEEPFWLPGLDGQVVIDRWNPTHIPRPTTHCKGKVLIADTTTAYGYYWLEPSSSSGTQFELPYYDMLSGPPTNVVDRGGFNGVRIERSSSGAFGIDTTDETARFEIVAPSVSNTFMQRDVNLRLLCDTKYPIGHYRVVRTQDCAVCDPLSELDRLYSDLTFSSALGGENYVASFAYYFNLCECGKADLGKAGGEIGADCELDNNDFVAFINLFFDTDPRADLGMAGGLQGSDGLFDNNDFIAFIDLFFQGCIPVDDVAIFGCPPGENRMAGDGGAVRQTHAEEEDRSRFQSQRDESVQVSARQVLQALSAGLPAGLRGEFDVALASEQPITRELMLAALEAVFNAGWTTAR